MLYALCALRFLNYLTGFPFEIQGKRCFTSMHLFPVDFTQKRDFHIDILSPSYHNNGAFDRFPHEKEDISKTDDLVAHRPLPSFWMCWEREGCQKN
jgi:hypothetical protein